MVAPGVKQLCNTTHWCNFTLKSGGDQWCRQDLVSGGHDDRGAEGGASRRQRRQLGGVWEGCLLPSQLGGLGSVVSSPSGVWGGAPATIAFSAYFRPQNASGSKKIRFSCKFQLEKVVVTVTTTFKSGSNKSPSSHTKLRL